MRVPVRAAGLGLLLLIGSAAAQAVPVPARQRALELDPSPDRPAFGVEYRGALRATLGAEMPALGRRTHTEWAVVVLPLLELHNDPDADSFVPNEYWRGRISLEAWWTPGLGQVHPFAMGLALEHESDHSTARVDSTWGFVSLNDLGLRTLTVMSLGPADLGLGAQLGVFFGSCTRDPQRCRSFAGTTTAGGGANLVADFGRSFALAGFGPFVAWAVSGILGTGQVAFEKRLVVHAGGSFTQPDSGLWQLFGLFFVGHDVGVHRATDVRRDLGVGFRWTPR